MLWPIGNTINKLDMVKNVRRYSFVIKWVIRSQVLRLSKFIVKLMDAVNRLNDNGGK